MCPTHANYSQFAQEELLASVHLACECVQQIDGYALNESLLFRLGDAVQQDLDEALVLEELGATGNICNLRTPCELNPGAYHIGGHVELGECEVTIPQHGVVREMHLHAIEQRANDVVPQQSSELGAIPALDNVEQCGTGGGFQSIVQNI